MNETLLTLWNAIKCLLALVGMGSFLGGFAALIVAPSRTGNWQKVWKYIALFLHAVFVVCLLVVISGALPLDRLTTNGAFGLMLLAFLVTFLMLVNRVLMVYVPRVQVWFIRGIQAIIGLVALFALILIPPWHRMLEPVGAWILTPGVMTYWIQLVLFAWFLFLGAGAACLFGDADSDVAFWFYLGFTILDAVVTFSLLFVGAFWLWIVIAAILLVVGVILTVTSKW